MDIEKNTIMMQLKNEGGRGTFNYHILSHWPISEHDIDFIM